MEYDCYLCGKKTHRAPSERARYDRIFCSKECWYIWLNVHLFIRQTLEIKERIYRRLI